MNDEPPRSDETAAVVAAFLLTLLGGFIWFLFLNLLEYIDL